MSWYRSILYVFCSTCRQRKSRTVRYAFPFVLGALAIVGAVTVTSDDQTIVEVESSKANVRAGETLELDVYVTAHKPVNAVDISVAVPTAQLEVMGIDVGESVITLWTEDPYTEDGTVFLRGGTFRKGFLGRHLIATINARAKETGLAYVTVTDSLLLAGDGDATEITAAANPSEEVKLYIAQEDGTFLSGDEAGGTFEASAEVKIVSDIDGDGNVTLQDISQFMAGWRSQTTIYDFNNDGRMTFTDFAIILAHSFLK